MNAIPMTLPNVMVTEKEQLWKEHAKRQKESGLTRKEYCCKHQLNYDHFGYWARKWRQQTVPSKLVPIHVNSLPTAIGPIKSETVCTLAFKNGNELKIHDKSVLPMLLSLWS